MSRISLPAVLLAALLFASCTDSHQSSGPVGPERSPATSVVPGQEPERVALEQLTQMVALALQDDGLRQQVLRAMQNSRHTAEHKLHFSDYLHGQNGGILLAKLASSSGRSRSEINALLRGVRPLEFYMPVQQHRENWEGGADLLVASLLEDDTAPIAFNLQGEPVPVQANVPPSTPTLVLVPVETDFSREIDVAKFRNRNDRGGRTIGTYLMECEPDTEFCDGDGGGSPMIWPAGLYMTYSSFTDVGEPWSKGSPEIEAHIHGPNSGDTTYGADLACAGEHLTEPARNFNQDNSTWTGQVLLFTQQQIENYNASYGNQGFNVMLWEDDDGACTIKTDKDIKQTLQAIAAIVGAAATVITKPNSTSAWVKAAGAFIGAAYASASWLLSNDDFLGAAPQVTTDATQTDVWQGGTQQNGYIYTELKFMQ